MALTNAYLITTKNLVPFLKAIQTARAPERFTSRFLVQLGFKSTNDRLFIGLLKALGFLDENGAPTQKYFDFLDETRSAKVLGEGIREAYDDLFSINTKANELTVDEVKNRLKTLTQGQKSDNVVGLIAATFKALCEQADWSELTPAGGEDNGAIQSMNETEKEAVPPLKKLMHPRSQPSELSLHYNLQIVLPDTRDPAVFDAIFRSIREHLL